MRHLIVVAHPLQDSVTMKLARAYAAELEQLGTSGLSWCAGHLAGSRPRLRVPSLFKWQVA